MTDALRSLVLSAAMRRSVLELVITDIRDRLRSRPELTVPELLEMLEAELAAGRGSDPERDLEVDTCRRCGRQLLVRGDFVTHVAADGGLNRGCRAASFTVASGWDDTLPRSWTAQRST